MTLAKNSPIAVLGTTQLLTTGSNKGWSYISGNYGPAPKITVKEPPKTFQTTMNSITSGIQSAGNFFDSASDFAQNGLTMNQKVELSSGTKKMLLGAVALIVLVIMKPWTWFKRKRY
jgi:hypothetical protein